MNEVYKFRLLKGKGKGIVMDKIKELLLLWVAIMICYVVATYLPMIGVGLAMMLGIFYGMWKY